MIGVYKIMHGVEKVNTEFFLFLPHNTGTQRHPVKLLKTVCPECQLSFMAGGMNAVVLRSCLRASLGHLLRHS